MTLAGLGLKAKEVDIEPKALIFAKV